MTRMSDARSQRRFEAKEKKRRRSVSVAFSVAFMSEEGGHRVSLFIGEDEPSESNLLSSMPVRGDLTHERKEDIVRKFMTLAAACIALPGEDTAVFDAVPVAPALRTETPITEPARGPEKIEKRSKPDLWSEILNSDPKKQEGE